MKKILFTAGLLLLITPVTFISCKKDKSNNPTAQSCEISGYLDSLNTTYSSTLTITRSGDKIQSVTGSGTSQLNRIFSYAGNTIIVNTSDPTQGGINQIDSVILNSNGMIGNIFTRASTAAYYRVQTMTYDASNQLQTIIGMNSQIGVPTDTTTFQWNNGDMISQTNALIYGNITYDFYSDRPVVDGDDLTFSQLTQYGALYIKNAHLVKSVFHNISGTTLYYNYFFNGNSISSVQHQMFVTGDTSRTTQDQIIYKYICQ